MRFVVPALLIAFQSFLIAFFVLAIAQNIDPLIYSSLVIVNLIGIGLNLYALTE